MTLATDLGADIDGGWWLRTGLIARELPGLVTLLADRLGEVVDIKVNWTVDGPPRLNFYGGECKRQPVMTVRGSIGSANLLVVPYRTTPALAMMVLRHAANLPVDAFHLDSDAFKVADGIVRAARSQRAAIRLGDGLAVQV